MFTQTELAFRVLVSVAMRDNATINFRKFALVTACKDDDATVALIEQVTAKCVERNVPDLASLVSLKKSDPMYDDTKAKHYDLIADTCRIWAQGILRRETFYCTVCGKPLWNEASDIHAACMDKSDDAREDAPEVEEPVLTPDA